MPDVCQKAGDGPDCGRVTGYSETTPWFRLGCPHDILHSDMNGLIQVSAEAGLLSTSQAAIPLLLFSLAHINLTGEIRCTFPKATGVLSLTTS